MNFRYQIVDEAQYIKNAATQSARAVKGVAARTRFALDRNAGGKIGWRNCEHI